MPSHVCGLCDLPITQDWPAFISRGGVTVAYHHDSFGPEPTCFMRAQHQLNGEQFAEFFRGLGQE